MFLDMILIYECQLLSYKPSMNSLNLKWKKNTIQLTLAIKIKHSGMNLAKYVQVIYEENHKNMKKSKNK